MMTECKFHHGITLNPNSHSLLRSTDSVFNGHHSAIIKTLDILLSFVLLFPLIVRNQEESKQSVLYFEGETRFIEPE